MGLRAICISILVGVVAGAGNGSLAQSGPIVGWGENFAGQAQSQPGSFIAVAATASTSCAIRSDGTLFAWGDPFNPAINVPAGTFTDIDGGSGIGFYIARRTNGTLAGWGINNSGQASPPSGTFIKASAGEQHALGLRADGSLAQWGAPWAGSPPPGNDFIDVAVGRQFNLALRSNGTIEAWGSNTFGELNVPAGTYTAVAAMLAGGVAIRSDGTVAVWGQAPNLGPLEGQVVSKIAASDRNVLALRPDGTLVFPDSQLPPPAGQYMAIGAGQGHFLAVVPAPGAVVTIASFVLVSTRRPLRTHRSSK